MAKYIGPKCKICRRAGEKLMLKGERCDSTKCAMVKRNYPPGQHAQKRARRLTEYGTQLREKQKAKKSYGLLEKQFKNYYEKALKKSGNTTEAIIEFLEMRLDNVVYRAGLAPSRSKSRQMISHGHIQVDGQRVDIPSFKVKKGEKIGIVKSSESNKDLLETAKTIENKEISSWLKVDKKALTCEIVAIPTSEIVQPPFALNLIIEFYSR